MQTDSVRLPFLETVGRSFKYVLKNKSLLKAIVPVIAGIFVLQLLLNMPILCAYSQEECNQRWVLLNLLVFSTASAGIIINYCRSIILKAESDYISKDFWKRIIFYLLSSIIFSIVISIPTILISGVLGIGLPTEARVVVSVITTFVVSIMLAPIFLVFPAISVDDYTLLNIKKIFTIARHNHNAIFWGQFVIMIPFWILNQGIAELYPLLDSPNYAVKMLITLLSVILSVIDAGFKGAFFAHIYQFFTFYDRKNR